MSPDGPGNGTGGLPVGSGGHPRLGLTYAEPIADHSEVRQRTLDVYRAALTRSHVDNLPKTWNSRPASIHIC